MNGDIDKWLNEKVADELAAARAASNGAPPAPATPSPPASSPSKPQSLTRLGIGRGGVITNKSTKIRTQGENPVTNPRPPSHDPRAKSVPPADPVSDLKAEHPAIAAPSLFTGMDIDINKKVPSPAPAQERIFSSAAPPLTAAASADTVVSFDTTVRQLLEIAQGQPKKMLHVTTSRFVLSLEVFKNPPSGSQASPGAAPKSH